MKVLFVTAYMGFGGTERVISVVANELARRGHSIGIYMTTCSNKSVYPLDKSIKLSSASKVESSMEILKSIKAYTKSFDPDVVVAFMPYPCIFTVFSLLGTKYPVVVSERNDPAKFDGKDASKFRFMVRDIAYSLAKGAVFQTEGAQSYFSKSIIKKSTIIINPLNTDAICEPYVGMRDKRIVNVGRLTSQKNQKLLLTAFSKICNDFPDWILEIYGDGEDRELLEKYSNELSINGRVVFCGNQKNVINLIKTAGLFAFSSDFEGLPNALAEAMAIGLPCVSTDCTPGGARMFIKDGENGFLVPIKDADALASAMKKVMENKELSNKFSNNAIKIRDMASTENVVDRWEEYLISIIK